MRSPLGALASLRNAAPVPYAPRSYGGGRFGFGTRMGRTAELGAMSSVGTLFAIVNRSAKATAGVGWRLWRTAPSGKVEDRVEVTRHAALDLWRKPNPFFSRMVFTEAGAQHKLLTGEQWWVIARHEASPIPLELWPVRPDRMEPVPDPNNFLAGYMYYGPSGEQIALRLEDVIFIRTPNPVDPYRGLGPVQSILIDLDATRASAEWNRNFFRNSAEPGGIIEAEPKLSDEQFDELRERWNEQHKGVSNAHRVAILEGGLKWRDRSFSQRDMQFAELRSVSREVIREAYGMPKSMLGTTEDVNRANAEAGEVMFARWLVRPELEAMKDALNQGLLPLFGRTGQGLEFDYDNPVPDDRELESKELTARANAVKALVEAGAYGPEALTAVGLPEIPFGAPDADPDRELLIKLVTRAPLLAPTILPMLGFELPEGAAPASADDPGAENRLALPSGGGLEIESAMRWQAVETIDDDTCDACRENDGKLYRNREDAYKDYPGGSGYINCEGAKYGNECRGKVVKRGKAT